MITFKIFSGDAGKLQSVQSLRFIAAFLVLIGHLFMEAKKHGLITEDVHAMIDMFPWGTGVDIFFIISGFVINHVMSRMENTPHNVKDFIIRRLIRIVPIYWLYTGLMVVAMVVFSGIVKSNTLESSHILASLFFIPWENPTTGELRPVLGQGGTLNYEIFFYAFAACAILLPQKYRNMFLTITLIPVFLFSHFLGEAPYFKVFLGYSIILEFILGIWLYEIYKRVKTLSTPLSLILIGFGLISMVVLADIGIDEDWRVLKRGLPSMIFSAGIIFFPLAQRSDTLINKLITLLGDASYSLYLSHPFVLVLLAMLWKHFDIASSIIYVGTATILCLCAAVISYVMIEKNITGYLIDLYEKYLSFSKASGSI